MPENFVWVSCACITTFSGASRFPTYAGKLLVCKQPQILEIRLPTTAGYWQTEQKNNFRRVQLKFDKFSKQLHTGTLELDKKALHDDQTFVFRAPPLRGFFVRAQCNIETAVLIGNRRPPWKLAGKVDFLGRPHQKSIDFLLVQHYFSLVMEVPWDSWNETRKFTFRLTNFGNSLSITHSSSSGPNCLLCWTWSNIRRAWGGARKARHKSCSTKLIAFRTIAPVPSRPEHPPACQFPSRTWHSASIRACRWTPPPGVVPCC